MLRHNMAINRRASMCVNYKLYVMLACVCVLLLLLPSGVESQQQNKQQCRDYCHNGGTVLMPSTVFGFCRCKCPPAFSGPRCQLRASNRKGAVTNGNGVGGTGLVDTNEVVYGDEIWRENATRQRRTRRRAARRISN